MLLFPVPFVILIMIIMYVNKDEFTFIQIQKRE